MTGQPQELADRIDAILPFLPLLDRPEAIGEWQGGQKDEHGVIHMPWFEFSQEMLAFLRALGMNGWVAPFDWVQWQEEAARYADPARLAQADVETIGKLFTTYVRRNRFVEGSLAGEAERGQLAAIVRRLGEIRDTLT